MAKQDRAVATRRRILEAAAAVFEREGYQAATITEILRVADVTKGALYFHFQSKEELVEGIFEAQQSAYAVASQGVKLQEMIDAGYVLAHRLRTEPLVRASVRLTLDHRTPGPDRRGPYVNWTEYILQLIEEAKKQGELLPHVVPSETAQLCVGVFAGLQLQSHTMSDYLDLPERLAIFHRHWIPSVAMPPILTALDFTVARAASVAAAADAVNAERDAVEDLVGVSIDGV